MFSRMFSRTTAPAVIRIDFPALDNFVAFLRENEQQQVDALAVEVRSLTARLKNSGDTLRAAITNEQK